MAAVVALVLSLIYLLVNGGVFVVTTSHRLKGRSHLAKATMDKCVVTSTPIFVVLFLLVAIYGTCF